MNQQRVKPGQYLALRTKISETTDDGVMVVKGIASDANETDSFGTRIKLSQRALDSFKANPVLLYNHNVDEPIGRVRSLAYNGGQLETEVEIFAGVKTPNGTDIQGLVKRGALNAFSIRFDDYKTRNVGDYTQIDADVMDELSLVSLPSNRKSLITMRSKGVELHGAPELLREHAPAPVDLRTKTNARAAGVLSLELLTQRLAEAIREERGDDGDSWYYGGSAYLISIYDDYCVWSEWGESGFFREGYSVDANGVVTLAGNIQEVLPTWVVVGNAPEENGEVLEDQQAAGGRAKTRTVSRLHPDDLKEIVSQLRASPLETAPRAEAQVEPEEAISLTEGLDTIRSLTARPAPESETVSLEDVRQHLRSLIPVIPDASDA